MPESDTNNFNGHAIRPDGQSAYTWRRIDERFGPETEIVRWNANTGKAVSRVRAIGRLNNLLFTPDGQRFVAERWGYDRQGDSIDAKGVDRACLAVHDAKTGRVISILSGSGGLDRIGLGFQISPDGRTVALGHRDGQITIVEAVTGQVRCSFRHNGPIGSLMFSPDNKLLVAQSLDAPVLVWDVRGGPTGFPTAPPDTAVLEAAWRDLAAEDAREAFDAIRLLAAFPDRAIPFLARQPVPTGLRAIRVAEALDWMNARAARELLDSWDLWR